MQNPTSQINPPKTPPIFSTAWEKLLPSQAAGLERGQAALVIAACLGLVAAVAMLLLTWLISGDLEWETAVIGLIFSLILVGIAALAHKNRGGLAAWLLIGLLTLLITLDTASYGLRSPAAAGYFIPIVLAACALGFWPGMSMAIFSSAVAWLVASANAAGWYTPLEPFEISQLTFNAPAYTVIFLLVALITGSWTGYIQRIIKTRYVNQNILRPGADYPGP